MDGSGGSPWVLVVDGLWACLNFFGPGNVLQAFVAGLAIHYTGRYAMKPVLEAQRRDNEERNLMVRGLAIVLLPVLIDMRDTVSAVLVIYQRKVNNENHTFIVDQDVIKMKIPVPSQLRDYTSKIMTIDHELAVIFLKLISFVESNNREVDKNFQRISVDSSVRYFISDERLIPHIIYMTLTHLIELLQVQDINYDPKDRVRSI